MSEEDIEKKAHGTYAFLAAFIVIFFIISSFAFVFGHMGIAARSIFVSFVFFLMFGFYYNVIEKKKRTAREIKP